MKLHHTIVSPGIHWVEVPEVGLRMVCGCPADTVKHLARRGLIQPIQVAGVPCESGPNGILLSDVAIQNGDFANLGEFPVLQMLYKQGMAIPGHPNHTGRRPLLVGTADQVLAQERYIYRGNYGLISREELVRAGMEPDEAAAAMRAKLAFAFGRIQDSKELLETRILGDTPLALAPGVSLERLRPNVFRFEAGDASAVVDLNLPPGVPYACPYVLGFRQVDPQYFSVIHSGEGDGWDIHRPCMSSVLTFQDRLYLVDAGPNLASTLTALGIGIEQVDGIFHTHAHDDHFAGLTTLMGASHRIPYYATPPVRTSVARKLAALLGTEEERFGDFFDVRDLRERAWNDIQGLEVMPVLLPHPVENNVFFFRTLWAEGHRTCAHLADLTSFRVLERMARASPDQPGLDPAAVEQIRRTMLSPVDLKKIDVGGGMIHGDAVDFRDDPTPRLLLAHRSGDLAPEEKEVGSSAAFGTVDVLIPSNLDGLRRHAFDTLKAHLPDVPVQDLRMLLNHPIIDVNPGSILLKEGAVPRDVQLVVTGSVERLRARDQISGTLQAGALVGDAAVLGHPQDPMAPWGGEPQPFTFRAASFVHLIRIPAPMYAEVVRRHDLLKRVRRTMAVREFLETTRLFGDTLPITVLRPIADDATQIHVPRGDFIPSHGPTLSLVRSGRVAALVGERVVEVLKERDFFGEPGAIFGVPALTRFQALEDTELLRIPGERIRDIPNLRWKLLEAYHRRAALILHSVGDGSFHWSDTFSIQVAEMDNHHRRLFEISNTLLEHRRDPEAFDSAFAALQDYTAYHFAAEEDLMVLYDYPGTRSHKDQHRDLTAQVLAWRKDLEGPQEAESLRLFLESWLVHHILDEDRKYGGWLNSRGVF